LRFLDEFILGPNEKQLIDTLLQGIAYHRKGQNFSSLQRVVELRNLTQ